MELIRTGMQIGQAVKNVQRLRQVLGVLAKYGFADVVQRMNLGRFLPQRFALFAEGTGDKTTPERIRLSFEELGPTFIKLGQLLSTRPDLLPEAYIEEFQKLQDNVQAVPYETVKAIVERELKRKIEDAFQVFDSKPLAAASIAQVHTAKLHSGESVVVKVQRPDIQKITDTDVSLLAFLANLLEKYVPETKIVGPKTIVDEFFRTLRYELDFAVEANNTTKSAENMASIPEIIIPQVYKHLSTHKVLTLEKIEGIRVNDLKAMDAAGIDRKKVVEVGARAFFKSVMLDGLFHGDLHGGNWFILPGNKIAIIDFGIIGRLSEKARDQLASILTSLLSEDYEKLCYQYAELANASPSTDFDSFQREARNVLSPYLGLSLNEINAGKVLIEATKVATKYNIKIPGDWMMVFKSILTVESIGRTLDPNFDLLGMGQELAKDLVKNQYSMQRLSRDLLWIAKDAAGVLQILPRQIKWFFRKLNSNDFAFEIKSPELEKIRHQLDINGRRMSSSILATGLFIAGSLALQTGVGPRIWDFPLIALLFFVVGASVLIGLFLKSFR